MNEQEQPTFAKGAQKDRIETELAQMKTTKPLERQSTPISVNTTSVPPRMPVSKTSVGIVCDSTYNGFGVKVLNVLKQQPADRAGIEEGDIILQMGTQKINALSDYSTALNKLKRGGKLIIKVKRGVTVQSFTLVNL
jgi:S1-C subfamily serine protease